MPHFLDREDCTYTQSAPRDYWYRFKDAMLPGDHFRRYAFVSSQEDALCVRDRHIIGVDNLLWGSDYPNQESTCPKSREILERIQADCTDQVKAKITWGNAATVYHPE